MAEMPIDKLMDSAITPFFTSCYDGDQGACKQLDKACQENGSICGVIIC